MKHTLSVLVEDESGALVESLVFLLEGDLILIALQWVMLNQKGFRINNGSGR